MTLRDLVVCGFDENGASERAFSKQRHSRASGLVLHRLDGRPQLV